MVPVAQKSRPRPPRSPPPGARDTPHRSRPAPPPPCPDPPALRHSAPQDPQADPVPAGPALAPMLTKHEAHPGSLTPQEHPHAAPCPDRRSGPSDGKEAAPPPRPRQRQPTNRQSKVVDASDHALFTMSLPRATSRIRVLRLHQAPRPHGPSYRSIISSRCRTTPPARATGRTICDLRHVRAFGLCSICTRCPGLVVPARSRVPQVRLPERRIWRGRSRAMASRGLAFWRHAERV